MFSSGCSKKCGFVARIHASRKIFPGEEALCRYSSARRVKKAALGLRGRGRSATAPESGKVLLAGLCGFSIEKQGGCPFPKGKKQPPISFSRSLSDESARRLIPILPACRQHSANTDLLPSAPFRCRNTV